MENKKSKIFLTVVITFLATSVLYLACFFVFPQFFEGVASLVPDSFFSSFSGGDLAEIEAIVDEYFIDDVDKEVLDSMAAKGYVAGLKDEYSEYYTKSEFESVSAEISGNYKGIGVQVTNIDNKIVITKVYKGSPAYKAELKKGDVLKKVDGKEYDGNALDSAVSAIRNPDGKAEVSLEIIRDGKTIDVKIKKEDVIIPVVESKMLSDNIGYINLMQFTEDADESFRTHLNKLMSADAKALIIDLRDNPGGMLTTVVDIADLLLPEGTILTIKGKNTEEEKYVSGETFVDIPLYVLINGSSASASEVLAGALKDHKRATIIGETSYGKGVVQSIINLKSGAALKITTARYYTPSGVCIDSKGIEPDYKVETEDILTEQDLQLKKAIELIGASKKK